MSLTARLARCAQRRRLQSRYCYGPNEHASNRTLFQQRQRGGGANANGRVGPQRASLASARRRQKSARWPNEHASTAKLTNPSARCRARGGANRTRGDACSLLVPPGATAKLTNPSARWHQQPACVDSKTHESKRPVAPTASMRRQQRLTNPIGPLSQHRRRQRRAVTPTECAVAKRAGADSKTARWRRRATVAPTGPRGTAPRPSRQTALQNSRFKHDPARVVEDERATATDSTDAPSTHGRLQTRNTRGTSSTNGARRQSHTAACRVPSTRNTRGT